MVYAVVAPQAGHAHASRGRWYLAVARPKFASRRGEVMAGPSRHRPSGPMEMAAPKAQPTFPGRPAPHQNVEQAMLVGNHRKRKHMLRMR